MKKFFKKPLGIVLILIIISIISWVFFSKDKKPALEFISATKNELISEVNVTGRVKSADNVDLSFNTSGRVISVFLKEGDTVQKGQIIAKLDDRNALLNLQSERIKYEDLITENPRDVLTAENNSKQAKEDLNKSFDTAFSSLTTAFAEMKDIIQQLEKLYSGTGYLNEQKFTNGSTSRDYVTTAKTIYYEIKKDLKEKQKFWSNISRHSENTLIEQTLSDIYKTAQLVSSGVKKAKSAIDYVKDRDESTEELGLVAQSNISELANTINEQVSDLLLAQNTIFDNKRKVETTSIDLIDLKSESKQFEIQLAELSIKQKEKDLEDHYLYSPINGTISKQNLKVGEVISTNNIATSVISEQKFNIESNVPEADIAKIKIDNSAKITLDAYGRNVIFEAKVVSISPAETIIEGVATYKITIEFLTGDERIRPGMTANIDILSAKLENVITIPQRTVTRKNGSSFVRILNSDESVEEREVQTGLRGSLGDIEIINGISVGDKIVTSE